LTLLLVSHFELFSASLCFFNNLVELLDASLDVRLAVFFERRQLLPELRRDLLGPPALFERGERVLSQHLQETLSHVVVRRVVPDGGGAHVGPGHHAVVHAGGPLLRVEEGLGLK
jgi:hypothetical protein